MKATIIEIESQRLSDFCYYHGGIRVADEWRPFDFMFGNNESTVATCKDEEGDECFILCKHPKLGQVVEFEKEGFYPYDNNPEPNRWGRNYDD